MFSHLMRVLWKHSFCIQYVNLPCLLPLLLTLPSFVPLDMMEVKMA